MKIGRNDPCPCGSGKKYKQCCLKRMNRSEYDMIRMEELEQARKEVDKTEGKNPMRQNMFKVV